MTNSQIGESIPPPKVPGGAGMSPKIGSRFLRWAAVLLAAAVVLFFAPPQGVTPQAWRLFAIFVATILGLILQPLPIGAMALIGVAVAMVTKSATAGQALAGYADPLVWMVLAAFWIARGMVKTGLGRRIALLFIRATGHTSLGLGYSIIASDLVLGTVIPSTGARAGGILFPITRSMAETCGSTPGPTARQLGAYLMALTYHCDNTVAGMFLTGQASGPLIAALAKQATGIELSYSRWALGAIVPGLVCLTMLPLLLYRILPPTMKHTPEATAFADTELAQLGPMSRVEKLMLLAFFLVILLWSTKSWHGVDYPVVALLAVALLLLTNVINWEDIVSERPAWDVFIWYGGIYQMARLVGDSGITKVFAQDVGVHLAGAKWWLALAVVVTIFSYSHYAFASSTAQVSAMYLPFVLVAVAAGAPPMMAVLPMAYLCPVGASLTHYGTVTGPIYFGAGYMSQGTWWKVGFIAATAIMLTWVGVGLFWWKLLGWW